MTLVVIGPHGAGKSTLGRALARALGLPFNDEIGARLARERPASLLPQHGQPDFDEQVFAQELERDLCAPLDRVVESWHPGNLAYAERRSPLIVARHLERVRASVLRADAVAIAVTADHEVLARRQHEPGDLAFFEAVGRGATAWARRLGMPILGSYDTSTVEVSVLVATILQQLRSGS